MGVSVAECCTNVVLSSEMNTATAYTGEFTKHSKDNNGRIIYKQENGENFLYVNGNNHWIVSQGYFLLKYYTILFFNAS